MTRWDIVETNTCFSLFIRFRSHVAVPNQIVLVSQVVKAHTESNSILKPSDRLMCPVSTFLLAME